MYKRQTWLASSPKAAALRIEAGWDLPAINDEATLASYLDITPPDNRQAVFDSLDYLVTPPVIEDYALMSDIIGQALSAAAEKLDCHYDQGLLWADYDEDWNRSSQGGYRLTAQEVPTDTPGLCSAHVAVEQEGETLFEITVAWQEEVTTYAQ